MRSTLEVTRDFLPHLRRGAPACGFEVLAKVVYNRDLDTYLVEIEGDAVPAARQVHAVFSRHRAEGREWVTVEFTPLESI